MKKLLAFLFVAAALTGCYNDSEEELYPKPNNGGGGGGGTDTVKFSTQVQPILSANCGTGGCHDAATKANNYDLNTYQGALAASPRMIGAINWQSGFSAMPKGAPKLPQSSIDLITKWVNAGSPNN